MKSPCPGPSAEQKDGDRATLISHTISHTARVQLEARRRAARGSERTQRARCVQAMGGGPSKEDLRRELSRERRVTREEREKAERERRAARDAQEKAERAQQEAERAQQEVERARRARSRAMCVAMIVVVTLIVAGATTAADTTPGGKNGDCGTGSDGNLMHVDTPTPSAHIEEPISDMGCATPVGNTRTCSGSDVCHVTQEQLSSCTVTNYIARSGSSIGFSVGTEDFSGTQISSDKGTTSVGASSRVSTVSTTLEPA